MPFILRQISLFLLLYLSPSVSPAQAPFLWASFQLLTSGITLVKHWCYIVLSLLRITMSQLLKSQDLIPPFWSNYASSPLLHPLPLAVSVSVFLCVCLLLSLLSSPSLSSPFSFSSCFCCCFIFLLFLLSFSSLSFTHTLSPSLLLPYELYMDENYLITSPQAVPSAHPLPSYFGEKYPVT